MESRPLEDSDESDWPAGLADNLAAVEARDGTSVGFHADCDGDDLLADGMVELVFDSTCTRAEMSYVVFEPNQDNCYGGYPEPVILCDSGAVHFSTWFKDVPELAASGVAVVVGPVDWALNLETEEAALNVKPGELGLVGFLSLVAESDATSCADGAICGQCDLVESSVE
jgi:hypothetical protein